MVTESRRYPARDRSVNMLDGLGEQDKPCLARDRSAGMLGGHGVQELPTPARDRPTDTLDGHGVLELPCPARDRSTGVPHGHRVQELPIPAGDHAPATGQGHREQEELADVDQFLRVAHPMDRAVARVALIVPRNRWLPVAWWPRLHLGLPPVAS